jgi:hypothetical protein
VCHCASCQRSTGCVAPAGIAHTLYFCAAVFQFGAEVAAALHPDVPAHAGQAGEPQREAPFRADHAAPVKR